MGFVEQPPELYLYPIEGRFVALRIPFMQIWGLSCGGQKLVHGKIVNVPVDNAPALNVLPRNISSTDTVTIKFKRKKAYKWCEFKENIWSMIVWKAAHFLVHNSDL